MKRIVLVLFAFVLFCVNSNVVLAADSHPLEISLWENGNYQRKASDGSTYTYAPGINIYNYENKDKVKVEISNCKYGGKKITNKTTRSSSSCSMGQLSDSATGNGSGNSNARAVFTIIKSDYKKDAQISFTITAYKKNDKKSKVSKSFNLDIKNGKLVAPKDTGNGKDSKGNDVINNDTQKEDANGKKNTSTTTADKGEAGLVKGTSPGEYDPSKANVKCGDISDLISDYWKYIVLLAPIALILLLTVDFVKAVVASDADQLKKSANAAIKRTIATVILLMLPLLLSILLGWFGIDLCI